MVAVRPDLKERDLVAVTDVEADLLERPLDLVRDHRAAVLGRADGMVEQGRDVVPLVEKVAHTHSVPHAARAGQAKGSGQMR